MQLIIDPVGADRKNTVSDVALVQAMLVKIVRPATAAAPATPGHPATLARSAGPYLASYDGKFSKATGDALLAFQTDHALIAPANSRVAPDPHVLPGTVAPGDKTWTTLVAALPIGFADLRVLPGYKVVYLQATAADLQAKTTAAAGKTFTLAFRPKVVGTINKLYTKHGIAIDVDRDGDRRTFQAQYDLLNSGRGVTRAGPGESNHNFGAAVDLGFNRLRWLRPNGEVVENEDSWLHRLEASHVAASELTAFWDVLREAGVAAGAFRGPAGDRPHLQNWDDDGVSMVNRLPVLLTLSGHMRWGRAHGSYTCDLGLHGEKVAVGTASQIWNNEATVTIATLNRLRAPLHGHPAAHPVAHPGPPARPIPPVRSGPAPQAGARTPITPATAADVDRMKTALRQEFELADANWQAWTPR